MNQTVEAWLEDFKATNPTPEKIQEEISEVERSLKNEHIWELGHRGRGRNPHSDNIAFLSEYLGILKEM